MTSSSRWRDLVVPARFSSQLAWASAACSSPGGRGRPPGRGAGWPAARGRPVGCGPGPAWGRSGRAGAGRSRPGAAVVRRGSAGRRLTGLAAHTSAHALSAQLQHPGGIQAADGAGSGASRGPVGPAQAGAGGRPWGATTSRRGCRHHPMAARARRSSGIPSRQPKANPSPPGPPAPPGSPPSGGLATARQAGQGPGGQPDISEEGELAGRQASQDRSGRSRSAGTRTRPSPPPLAGVCGGHGASRASPRRTSR